MKGKSFSILMSSRHWRFQPAHLKVVVLAVFKSSCTHVELDKEEKMNDKGRRMGSPWRGTSIKSRTSSQAPSYASPSPKLSQTHWLADGGWGVELLTSLKRILLQDIVRDTKEKTLQEWLMLPKIRCAVRVSYQSDLGDFRSPHVIRCCGIYA